MPALCDEQYDDFDPLPPVETEHDQQVTMIKNFFWKAARQDQIAHDLSHALLLIQSAVSRKNADTLAPDDCEELLKLANTARREAEARLGSQCVFGEIEEGMEAVSSQIYLWTLTTVERAKYTAAFRLRMGRNIRTLRNALHNIDNRLQNARADREERSARDAKIIQKTLGSLEMLGIKVA
jgi:hypothetical protein